MTRTRSRRTASASSARQELAWRDKPSTVRVDIRRPAAQVDFGKMDWLVDVQPGRQRSLWALIVTLALSRYQFVWPNVPGKRPRHRAPLTAAHGRFARVPSSAADYRNAALERMGDADDLKRLQRFPFAMYAAGAAVECILRAFRHAAREHAAHHDVVAHFASCDRERLGERAWAKLRGPVQTVHLLWLNNFRYMDESRLRRHLNELKYYERVKRGSDTLKVACIELMNAALAIVTVGDERWRNP